MVRGGCNGSSNGNLFDTWGGYLFLLSVAPLCVDDLTKCDVAIARRGGILVDARIDRGHFSCFLSTGRGSFIKN